MDRHGTRRGFLAALGGGVAALAGCAGGRSAPTAGASGGPPLAAQTRPLSYSLSKLREEIISGGVPKDGIPAIDDPSFVPPDEADRWLDDGDVVFGLARDGAARAYPQRILVWHEVVNDTVAGLPVSVTYCPLTGTTLGFERGETTFGVSGDLVNNNLVAYDRATDSRWPQMLATAISGRFEGRSLREVPVAWTTWGHWRAAHPDTRVLSRDTGYARDYNRDPYGSYNPKRGHYAQNKGDREQPSIFPPLSVDGRYHMKKVVVGARTGDGAVAFVKDGLRESALLSGEVGGVAYLAVYDPRLDTGYVYRNPEDRPFGRDGGAVVGPDGETPAPDALPVERVYSFDSMWFAWAGFYPETAAVE